VTVTESPIEGAVETVEPGTIPSHLHPEGSFDLVITVARTEGTGIDGFGLLEHLRNRLPVIRKSFAINLEASSLESLIALPTY
jgi:hypothetical protein